MPLQPGAIQGEITRTTASDTGLTAEEGLWTRKGLGRTLATLTTRRLKHHVLAGRACCFLWVSC